MAHPVGTGLTPSLHLTSTTTDPGTTWPRALSPADFDERERRLLQQATQGRYRVLRVLGRGGMSSVFLAWEHGLERHVAVKLLSPTLRLNLEDRERFRREARVAANLTHTNIVPIFALGEGNGGLLYFAMRYVDGESLADRLERDGRLPIGEAIVILAALADALDHAHRRGVRHRDIKPANILLDRESGQPMLTDFGVATVLSSEHSRSEVQKALGTPDYMAPEHALGEQESDGRSDIYSLGVVGYRMLAGRLPFTGASPAEVIAQRVTTDPPPLAEVAPAIPPEVAKIVDRCLARDPKRRWKDGRSLCDALFALGKRRGSTMPLSERLRELATRVWG